ncbi:MAG: SH3 domain-containing protein [Acidobacteria bacterium]|nr:SH3 domain-containing protein [Acidobacteriota bacterium]
MCAPPACRAISLVKLVLVALPLALVALAACRSAAPPPAPEPPAVIVEAPPAAAPAPPPAPVVKVTGSSLNVRREPTTRAAVVGKAKRGERLEVLDDGGDWLLVRRAGGTEGWVAARYVARDEPCLPDKATAEVVDTPILSFVEGAPRGTVTVEGEVDPAGKVVRTTVTTNSTGSDAAAVVAAGELERMRFAPPVRRCRPVRFIYVYTRTF